MRTSRLRPLTAAGALTALLCGGCSPAPPSPLDPAPPAPSPFVPSGSSRTASSPSVSGSTPPSASPSASPSTVCSRVRLCEVEAPVDVDGDGEDDEVGVVTDMVRHGEGAGVVQVRVRTATGRTLVSTSRSASWTGAAWFGAALIDGRDGSELVVGQTMGAHSQFFRVLTYRKGRLVTLRAPRYPAEFGSGPDTSAWYTDSSAMFHDGIRRSVDDGQVVVTLTTLSRDDSGRRHSGWTAGYRWTAAGWELISTTRAHRKSDRAASRAAGWHVTGLPVQR